MFHKNKMGSMIRFTGTVFYSLWCSNSRKGFNGLKYMYSVISVIVDSPAGNTKNRESTRSWTGLVNAWRMADTRERLHIWQSLLTNYMWNICLVRVRHMADIYIWQTYVSVYTYRHISCETYERHMWASKYMPESPHVSM